MLDHQSLSLSLSYTMGAKMIANRVFYFDLQFRPKITGTSQKTPEFRKMATMISWSGIILVFFGVEQRIGGYEREEREERRREGEKERRRSGLRCDMLSCAVLSCSVIIYIYIHICCSKAVTFHNVFFFTLLFQALHLHIQIQIQIHIHIHRHIHAHAHIHVHVRVRVRLCACVFVCACLCGVCVCACDCVCCVYVCMCGSRRRR